ncbi:MAG: energy-coupling factor ABC transporter permease, partial [Planctomycetota bacterium]|nr:energy-coupling factor ABC transporter permease [Planctomycetota bacterium]
MRHDIAGMANLGRILFLMPFSRSPAAVGFPERSMHIPDGFLDMKTCAAAGALAAAGVAVALRQARSRLPRQAVPLMGAAGAFVFAAQMLNFPVAGGTSGHLMGGVLCTVLLGPAAAVLVVASVLIVQCLVFADGGVLALGANVLNMAVVPAAVGGLLHRMTTMTKLGVAPRIAVAAVAAWLSTLAAAATCAGELAAAGAAPAHIVFPAMLLVHALIGVGEAAITAMVLIFIARLRPDLLGNVPATQGSFAHTPAHTPARTGSPAAFGLL